MLKRLVLRLLLLSLLGLAALAVVLHFYLRQPLALTQGVEYQLQRGASLGHLARDLAARSLLPYPKLLLLYSRISGRGSAIIAGDYYFEPGLTIAQLLAMLERGEVELQQITLVEGWTLARVRQALREHQALTQTLSDDSDLLQLMGGAQHYPSAEGLFFPDTYYFRRAISDVELLRTAYQRMQQVLDAQWALRAKDLPYSSPYQALIMASLVERETGQGSERAQIAGVFVRRLQRRMRLQTDPAVIYGLGEHFDGNLRARHLQDASNLYNTYRHHGLPPTPIALAGLAAILAALHPQDGDALYFVAKGDGSHYFSATLSEHQRAVRQYQMYQRRKDYRSAPAPSQTSNADQGQP